MVMERLFSLMQDEAIKQIRFLPETDSWQKVEVIKIKMVKILQMFLI